MEGNAHSMGGNMRARDHRKQLVGAVLLALGPVLDQSAWANTIVVNRCNDEGGPQYFGRDLREAVAAAESGDTVDLSGLACSTITLTIGEIPILVDNITIKGPADHVLTVDAHNASRVFAQDNFGGSLEVDSLRLYRGSAAGKGGCINVPSGYLTLTDSEVASCVASSFGGGVSATSMTLTRTDLIGNTSSGTGGGGAFAINDIYLFQSTVTNNNANGSGAGLYANRKLSVNLFSVISGNVSTKGGGGGALGKVTAEVRSSSITDNYSSSNGGGGLAGGSTAIYGSVIQGNTSGGPGGGVFAFAGLKSIDTTISGNTSQSGGGGGIYCQGSLYLRSNTIDGNTAAGPAASARGGGVKVQSTAIYNQPIAVVNSTISGNQANAAGGLDIHAPTQMLILLGDTIAFNTVSAGLAAGADVIACQINVWTSIIAKNGPALFDLGMSQNCGYAEIPPPAGDHNLIMSSNLPFFGDLKADPKLAPLANNGGIVRTHALLPGSPAVDAGSNPMGLPYDSRGTGYVRVVGQPDIGAFELQVSEDRVFATGFETPG